MPAAGSAPCWPPYRRDRSSTASSSRLSQRVRHTGIPGHLAVIVLFDDGKGRPVAVWTAPTSPRAVPAPALPQPRPRSSACSALRPSPSACTCDVSRAGHHADTRVRSPPAVTAGPKLRADYRRIAARQGTRIARWPHAAEPARPGDLLLDGPALGVGSILLARLPGDGQGVVSGRATLPACRMHPVGGQT